MNISIEKRGRARWSLAGWMILLVLLWAMPAAADDDEEVDSYRVVIIEIPGGGEEALKDAISGIPNLELRSHDWFVEQVEERAFQPSTITDNPSDLRWVMDGSDIDLVIDFNVENDEDFQVRLITAEEGEAEREFLADRSHDGGLRRGGASVIRYGLEDFLDARPEVVAAAAQASEEESDDESDDDEEEIADSPQALREQAARDKDELGERFARDWLWARLHLRMLQKDTSVASNDAVYTYNSGGFFGYELDLEAFPFGQSNPDMVETGMYATFNHGFYGFTITDESTDESDEVSVHNLTIEGGALYRLDSPLEENNRQLRFKIGGRFESFSVTENPQIPSTTMTSLVLGTRLVLPVGLEEFAVTAGLDISPLSYFGTGSDRFGASAFSYGFSSELGILYEVMDNGFLSAGYTFRLIRTDFSGEGEPVGDSEDPVVFEDSNAFDLNQGLRAGFVYQY